MSNMSRYTEIQWCDQGARVHPVVYTVHLKVGPQSFTVGPPLPLDEAEWMREQLEVALKRIVQERRGDPTW